MDISKLKFTKIANTALMMTDNMGYMRWANEAYASLTGLHLPMWLNKDSGDISRKGYLRIHGNKGLLYETVQRTGQNVTCRIDFPAAENIITTALPVTSGDNLESIIYILTRPVKDQVEKLSQADSGMITNFINEPNVVISAPVMLGIYLKAAQMASFNTSAIITGESGVGKDVLARFIHSSSPRRNKNFIHINCSALPEALFESEMFGYEAGAFTGAIKKGKAGLLELANGGTLFLDEIGDLPLSLQPKLLTFLSSGEYLKVGANRPSNADVRIIAATNSNIKELVDKKLFRQELYYRLSTVELNIPPLRERVSEIPRFIEYFTKQYNEKYNKSCIFDSETIDVMEQQPWYGNIRELANIIERLILFATENVISVHNFSCEYSHALKISSNLPLRLQIEQYEKELIESALKSSMTLQQVADKLHIDLSTLTRKRQKYKI